VNPWRGQRPRFGQPVNKYGAKPTYVGGTRFASTREAKRYTVLAFMEKAGEIRGLMLQPRFEMTVLAPNGEVIKVGHYTADFEYESAPDWKRVVEDVKAPPSRTEAYQLRKRIVEAQYGISIREV